MVVSYKNITFSDKEELIKKYIISKKNCMALSWQSKKHCRNR